MIDFMPNANSTLLKHQQQLPDELRQSCVLLVFAEPVNSALLGEFLTIRLTPLQHKKSEDGFYLVNRIQPERLGPKFCPKCRSRLHAQSLNEFVCNNSRCEFSATGGLVAGPRSGILGIRIAPEFIVRTEPRESGIVTEWVDRVVLVLDRRYADDALAGIIRTANAIAEERGWKLK